MGKTNYTTEQIIVKLREVEVFCSQGKAISEAVRHRCENEGVLRSRIIELACNYGRYGYRRITSLLEVEGFAVSHKRVERIWWEEGLTVLQKQPKCRRLWRNDGSCTRLRAEYKNHVWSYDFVEDRPSNGKKIRFLNIMDEYSRECLFRMPKRSWKHQDVIETLADLFVTRGTPVYLRSDNGSKFTTTGLSAWLSHVGVATPVLTEPMAVSFFNFRNLLYLILTFAHSVCL